MKALAGILSLALVCSLAGSLRAAETVTLVDGQLYEMTDKAGSSTFEFNTYGSRINLPEGCRATLKVRRDHEGEPAIRPRIGVADGATLTIDLTAHTGGRRPIFNGAFICSGSGRVVIKGVSSVSIGRGGVTTDSYAILQAPDLSFVDAEGAAVASPSLVIDGCILYLDVPADLPLTLLSNARIYDGSGRYADRLPVDSETGRLVVENLAYIDTFFGGRPDGRTFLVKGSGSYWAVPSAAGPTGISYDSVAGWAVTNDVLLADATSRYVLASRNSGTVYGRIAGAGSFEMTHYDSANFVWDSTYPSYVDIAATVDIDGAFVAGRSNAHARLPDGARFGGMTLADAATLTGCYLLTGGAVSWTLTGASKGGVVHLGRGSTLTLAGDAGSLSVVPNSSDSPTLVLASLKKGGRVTYGNGVVGRLGETASGIFHVETHSGGLFCTTLDAANEPLDANGERRVTIAGEGGEIASLAGGLRVELADAATEVTVSGDLTNAPNVFLNGGTVTVRDATLPALLSRAMLWCDASRAETVSPVVRGGVPAGDYPYSPDGKPYPYVMGWRDCRADAAHPYRFYYLHNSVNYVQPYLVTNGLNNLAYLSFNTIAKSAGAIQAARLILRDADNKETTTIPKRAFLVYGSQEGGGKAVLATTEGTLLRAGTTVSSPILPATAADCSLRVNGADQTPATGARFNGGWQILNVDVGGRSVCGIGSYNSDGMKSSGGMNYAEILFFDEDLTVAEQARIEEYLAEKWAVPDVTRLPHVDAEARVNGAGTVRLQANATLGGVFSGTVDLGGKELTLAAPSPTAAEIAALPGLSGWFDPSDVATVEAKGDRTAGTGYVGTIYNRVGWTEETPVSDGGTVIVGWSDTRSPCLRADGWLDFRKGSRLPGSPDGALLRFNVAPNYPVLAETPLPVRAIVMATDSSAGGGMPYSHTRTMSNPVSRAAISDDGLALSSAASPLLPAGFNVSRDAVRQYLDGVPLDGKTRGFNGRKEVYTSVFQGVDYSLAVFGDYQRNVATNANGEVQGEILGEILTFSTELSDADRRVAEGYLMSKWCGGTQAGFGDFSQATVTGEGRLHVPAGAPHPQFAAAFTGTADFADAELRFAVPSASTGEVAGAVVAPGATLAFAPSVTLAVTGDHVRPGTYTLVSAAAIAPGTEWRLASENPRLANAVLTVTATDVTLTVDAKGFVLFVK